MSENTPNFELEFDEGTSPEASSQTQQQESPAPVIPDKYKGKSVFDLIDMHQNAERKISEQGNDLAEQRRLSDQILGLKKENVKIPVTTDDLLSNPDAALEKAISGSDVAARQQQTADRLQVLEKSIGQREFERSFPRFMDDVNNPEFRTWVGSNRARQALLAELNNSYNFDAGTSLWEMWKEKQNAPSPQTNSQNRRETIRNASTVRSGPSEGNSKTIFSRAKLLALQERAVRGDREAQIKWNDSEFQKEYQQAYADGRVK